MDQNISWAMHESNAKFLNQISCFHATVGIKQEASLTHLAFNFRNKDSGYTLYQRIPLSNCCEPMPEPEGGGGGGTSTVK